MFFLQTLNIEWGQIDPKDNRRVKCMMHVNLYKIRNWGTLGMVPDSFCPINLEEEMISQKDAVIQKYGVCSMLQSLRMCFEWICAVFWIHSCLAF